MDTLTAARAQMEVSLGFHMIFAALGIGMPLLTVASEARWLRTGEAHYRALARKWARATALTFAVGAVSGTALSFELGLLWPRFMAYAGPTLGSAFALEGYAFFLEAIFLGLYLYGWERVSARAHLAAGAVVAFCGAVSGILVVGANAWMQTPAGRDPLAPFRSPAWFQMSLHSTLACYVATGFAVAGVYAVGMLRGRRDAYHRSGIGIALSVAAVAAVLQPLSGDVSARNVARYQPAKLAAMEALFETQRGAPLLVGGLPDVEAGRVRWGLEIPRGLSLLAAHDPGAVVRGLESFAPELRPNVMVAHLAFQAMVGSGFALAALGLAYWLARWRRREGARALLLALVLGSPLGFLALEAGWVVTEVGRQPWIIYGVMPTRAGVTPLAAVPVTFYGFSLLYLGLGTALAVLLRSLAGGGEAHGS